MSRPLSESEVEVSWASKLEVPMTVSAACSTSKKAEGKSQNHEKEQTQICVKTCKFAAIVVSLKESDYSQ